MGAVVLPDLDRCRRSRLHRHIGRNGGYRPLPVLCLRRDLPGPADPRAYHLQGVGGCLARPSWPGSSRPSTSFLPLDIKTWMPGTRPGMTKKIDRLRAPKRPSPQASSSILTRRSEEHTSELQSPDHLVCRLLLERK